MNSDLHLLYVHFCCCPRIKVMFSFALFKKERICRSSTEIWIYWKHRINTELSHSTRYFDTKLDCSYTSKFSLNYCLKTKSLRSHQKILSVQPNHQACLLDPPPSCPCEFNEALCPKAECSKSTLKTGCGCVHISFKHLLGGCSQLEQIC